MAASPKYKVYRNGEYVAACKHPDEAAILICVLGDGSDVRLGHRKKDVLLCGSEVDRDSYDVTAEIIYAQEGRLLRQRVVRELVARRVK